MGDLKKHMLDFQLVKYFHSHHEKSTPNQTYPHSTTIKTHTEKLNHLIILSFQASERDAAKRRGSKKHIVNLHI